MTGTFPLNRYQSVKCIIHSEKEGTKTVPLGHYYYKQYLFFSKGYQITDSQKVPFGVLFRYLYFSECTISGIMGSPRKVSQQYEMIKGGTLKTHHFEPNRYSANSFNAYQIYIAFQSTVNISGYQSSSRINQS